ncbi:H-2 class I histocompatibility antigen, alpha chain-like isoform X2 [Hoplias malabaricus]
MFYLFIVQSEDSSHNIYQFSEETLLDDTQTDSYSSRDGIRTPKQSWMKEIKDSEWRTGTDKLKYEGQWVNKVLQLQLEAFKHKASERHVLQWRISCEGEKLPDGSVSTLNCINEYGYDGEDLMSYNWTSRQWSVSVKEAQETVEKFKSEEGPDPARVCQDCVKWMGIYLQYSPQHTPTVPDVYVFAKKSQTESSRLNLTCLATGFYPKDLKMRLRIFTTSLPDHLLTSSGVRPNGDGTYQLRKSVDVQEEDTAGYDCSVSHVSFSEAVITPWDGSCSHCRDRRVTVAIVVVILLVLLGAVVFIFLWKKYKTVQGRSGSRAYLESLGSRQEHTLGEAPVLHSVTGGVSNRNSSHFRPVQRKLQQEKSGVKEGVQQCVTGYSCN